MGVFELKSPPKFLRSESTGIKMKILQSNLAVNDTYVIEGPGPDIVISRAEGDSNDYGKLYLDLKRSPFTTSNMDRQLSRQMFVR